MNDHLLLPAIVATLLIMPSVVDVLADDNINVEERNEFEKNFLEWVGTVNASKTSADSIESIGQEKAMVEKIIRVSKKDDGHCKTIQDAVNRVPEGNKKCVIIKIGPGIYREKVIVPKSKPYIRMEGAGMEVTKIRWDDTARKSGSTFTSATVSVMAHHFVARDISFENTAPPPQPGEEHKQAVAFQISGDKSRFYNCGFYGAQDTLYDHYGRHYFKNCFIQGSIDFIFGDGLSLYEGCHLNTLSVNHGSLTAQRRLSAKEKSGFSFVNCTVDGSGAVYLGRAWGPYSRVVFIYTYMDNIIVQQGWDDWGISSRRRSVYYGQYKCYGPGANQHGRVVWAHELTEAEATPFMTLNFINGKSWVRD